MDHQGSNGAVSVRFKLPSEAGAERAWVVGEFNNWSMASHPMKRKDDGSLELVVTLVPGTYRFRYYLGDGRWENAWDAETYAANEFGGADSVVVVRPVRRDGNGTQAE